MSLQWSGSRPVASSLVQDRITELLLRPGEPVTRQVDCVAMRTSLFFQSPSCDLSICFVSPAFLHFLMGFWLVFVKESGDCLGIG